LNIVVKIFMYKALKLSKETYVFSNLNCNITPLQILKELVKVEPFSLLNELSFDSITLVSHGKTLELNKTLSELKICNDDRDIEIIIIPSLLEGG
jgi:hypothetical protein